MVSQLETLAGDLLNMCVLVAFGVLGGLARVISMSKDEKISALDMLKEMFISGFAGLMIAFLLNDLLVSMGYLSYFAVGMAGYTAPYTLKFLTNKFKSLVGKGDGNVG